MKTLKGLVFNLYFCFLLWKADYVKGDGFKIAYHVICDGDDLVSLSYNLMNGETEIYPRYIHLDENEASNMEQEASFLDGICSDEGFKGRLMGYPMSPSLQHGYVMVGVKGTKKSPESNANYFTDSIFNQPVDQRSGKLRSNRMKRLRVNRMKKLRATRMKKLRAVRMKKSQPELAYSY